jgi:SAM-dependent methyltransferase
MRQLAGKRWPPPQCHLDTIGRELSGPEPKDRMRSVVARMAAQAAPDFSGIDWERELAGFAVRAEQSGLREGSIDAATITLVLHECPDAVKREILAEVHSVLRPGGVLVLSHTPQDDLFGHRGFYEPYREEWARFDPEALLRAVGFAAIEVHDAAPPLWTRVAHKAARD